MQRPTSIGPRHGLSIMEVLFAIAVLTIGLLGVAQILPVASNNAAGALQTDRAVEEINNRIARDIAKLRGFFDEVIVANNSQAAFNTSRLRYNQISTQAFGSHIANYEQNTGVTLPQPPLPDAFCIDPWFLSTVSTVRDDAGPNFFDNRNAYDRTVFPCYDPRYQPFAASPSAAMSATVSLGWNSPRFTRVALPYDGTSGLLSAASAQALARPGDEFSLIKPDDSTFPPGLAIQRSTNGARSLRKNNVSSRYSSVVLMSRSAPGSSLFDAAVVTMKDRHMVTVPGGSYDGSAGLAAHNLAPYTATDPSIVNGPPPAESELLYPGEQLGFVSYAGQPILGGGGGTFTFWTSAAVKPTVREGGWIMLMRREYKRQIDTPTGGADPLIVPGALKYAWYRVSDVVAKPQIDATPSGLPIFATTISVRGPDWVFHPTQVQLFPGISSPPYFGNPAQPTWAGAPIFDATSLPGNGSDPNQTVGGARPYSPLYKHQDYGTFITIMPDVISVKQFQVQL